MHLRKAAIHPYLFEGVENAEFAPEDPPEFGEHLINASGKLKMLDRLLKEFQGKHRILIFSQFKMVLDILADFCYMREYEYARLDGETDFYDRDDEVREFMRQDEEGNYCSEKWIFLISTRAGGLGLNLVGADTVILFDSDWNPQCDLQAMDRAHRIGQRKPVNVYRMITKHSIEEKMLEKQLMKLKFDYLIVAKGRAAEYDDVDDNGKKKDSIENLFNFDVSKLSKQEYKDLVQFGANKIFGNDDDEEDIDAIDLSEILERGEMATIDQVK